MRKTIFSFGILTLFLQGLLFADPVQLGTVKISFDYNRMAIDYANNQFAVWIEDMEGRLIKTLFVTRFTTHEGLQNRPESLPEWRKKSGISTMNMSEIDALSGATPKANRLIFEWKGDDAEGRYLPSGQYRFFIEANYYWADTITYSGIISIGSSKSKNMELLLNASEEAALSKLIDNVTAKFVPLR